MELRRRTAPQTLPSALLLLSLLLLSTPSTTAQNNSATALTNRYWDCCKPSCGWNGKAKFNQPVASCSIDDAPFHDFNEGTGCKGGTAYTCSNQQPWAVNDTFSFGFSGVYIKDHLEDFWCCACYELTFLNVAQGAGNTSSIAGKKMIVQATNSGYDVIGNNKFALAIPGGNTTSFDACASQYGVPNTTFGTDNEGVSDRSQCDAMPAALKNGCYWRFDWLHAVDRPEVNYTRVQCPAELTNITGCVRDDDKSFSLSAAVPSVSRRSAPVVVAVAVVLGLLLS